MIKNGKPGTIMPPWGGQLSDDEINTLVAFMRSEAAGAAVKWTEKDIWASLTVITPEEKLPDKPTYTMNLDNLMLVTEREAHSIAVIDGDTHPACLAKYPRRTGHTAMLSIRPIHAGLTIWGEMAGFSRSIYSA